jgi:hypothetical protein
MNVPGPFQGVIQGVRFGELAAEVVVGAGKLLRSSTAPPVYVRVQLGS